MAGVIRVFFWGVRLALPWIGYVIGVAFNMVLITVISLWRGIPEACRLIADEWTERARASGFPTLYLRQLHMALSVVAFLVILSSWIVFSQFTVLVLRWIF